MSSLDQIPVVIGEGARAPETHWQGAVESVLHEVRHALARLVATGEATRIDLKSLPLGPGDLDRLVAFLGQGEVQASVDALGPTRVQETATAGVWLVDYLNAEEQRLALHLEIAHVPEILRPQPRDLDDAIAALDARLRCIADDPPVERR